MFKGILVRRKRQRKRDGLPHLRQYDAGKTSAAPVSSIYASASTNS
jgi:hypothetical protein